MHLFMFLWVQWELLPQKKALPWEIQRHDSHCRPSHIQYIQQWLFMTRENSKVHKLIDFSFVINLHYLPCETEKCHTDDVVYFEEFDSSAQFGISCKLLVKIFKQEDCFISKVYSPSTWILEVCFFLCVWPWQWLYLCVSWEMEMEEKTCYLDCGGT